MNQEQIAGMASGLGMTASEKQIDGKHVWFFERDGHSTFLRDTEDYTEKQFQTGINNCSAKLGELNGAGIEPVETDAKTM